MSLIIKKASLIEVLGSREFYSLPEDVKELIDVLATEVDYEHMKAISLTLDTKVINPYSYVDREDLFSELSKEEKCFVLMELFGDSYDKEEAEATVETHYPGEI